MDEYASPGGGCHQRRRARGEVGTQSHFCRHRPRSDGVVLGGHPTPHVSGYLCIAAMETSVVCLMAQRQEEGCATIGQRVFVSTLGVCGLDSYQGHAHGVRQLECQNCYKCIGPEASSGGASWRLVAPHASIWACRSPKTGTATLSHLSHHPPSLERTPCTL